MDSFHIYLVEHQNNRISLTTPHTKYITFVSVKTTGGILGSIYLCTVTEEHIPEISISFMQLNFVDKNTSA